MTTIDLDALDHICGGAQRGQSPEQLRARKHELCSTPTPAIARQQYDWMVAHATPDSSEKGGIKRRAVADIGKLCGWPQPPR